MGYIPTEIHQFTIGSFQDFVPKERRCTDTKAARNNTRIAGAQVITDNKCRSRRHTIGYVSANFCICIVFGF